MSSSMVRMSYGFLVHLNFYISAIAVLGIMALAIMKEYKLIYVKYTKILWNFQVWCYDVHSCMHPLPIGISRGNTKTT